MNRDALEGRKDTIDKTMKAVKMLIIFFEIIGLTILGFMFYNIFYR